MVISMRMHHDIIKVRISKSQQSLVLINEKCNDQDKG